nr:hypothetical protein [uncultured Carboxylicivirga sp.]
METFRLFALAALGSMGIMELTDYPVLDQLPTEPLNVIAKSILSLTAGLLAALINRFYNKRINGNKKYRKQNKKQ